MEGLTKQFNQFRELVIAVLALLAALGLKFKSVGDLFNDQTQVTLTQVCIAACAIIFVVGSIYYVVGAIRRA